MSTAALLELDDIQHILLTRVPALSGRYEFLTFRSAAGGRAWLAEILGTVQSAAEAGSVALPTVHMILDRPFMIAIEDTTTGAILFLGHIEDPTQGG